MPVYGVDISLYQRGIDFNELKRNGVEFVIIKSSERLFRDPAFEQNYKSAINAGLKVGAYHYLTASTIEEAKREAEYCNSTIYGKSFEYPIFCDFEESKYKMNSCDYNAELIKAFCTTLENKGWWTGIYCNYDFYLNYINKNIFDRFSFWCAFWGSNKPDIKSIQMWQFGGEVNLLKSSTIAGFIIDQNYCYIDYPKCIKEKGLNNLIKDFIPMKEIEYIVKSGDTLWGIAESFYGDGSKYKEIADYNNIKNPSLISVGQKIKIRR